MTTTSPAPSPLRAPSGAPTLVLGGTGKTGRRVVQPLRALGLPVRVGSRSGSPAFDWDDRSTWGPALDGVGAVYLCYAPDLAVPGADRTVAELAHLAVAGGARRLVLLSGRGEPAAQAAEQAVRAAAGDAACTVVRASWFLQGFSEDVLLEGVLAGELALPVGDVPEPFVDADDIADVAVAALTQDGHDGQVYEVSGPRALSFAEVAAQISAATGRPFVVRPVPLDEFTDALSAAGTPPEVVELMAYLFTEVLDGRNATPADGVQRALGRPPTDIVEWARTTAATGVWDVG